MTRTISMNTKNKSMELVPLRVLGNDIGNSYTKTSEGVSFPSQVYRDEILELNSLALKLVWHKEDGDVNFIIGSAKNAVKLTNIYKVTTDEYKACLLASTVLSYEDKEDNINLKACIGVPYNYFKNEKIKKLYRDEIVGLGTQRVTLYYYRDKKLVEVNKIINILDCEINAEGAIPDYIGYDELPAMVSDFGGKTLDNTNYKLSSVTINGEVKKDIAFTGDTSQVHKFDDVLKDLKDRLNWHGYELDTDQELLALLDQDELYTDGGLVDFKQIKDEVIGGYVRRAYSYLCNIGFNQAKTKVLLGGCAQLIKDYMESLGLVSEGVVTVAPSSQFFNAINFKEQGLKSVDNSIYRIIEDNNIDE